MLKTIEKETFYSPDDLAVKLKISLSSVYKLIRKGEIPHVKLGKVYRVPATDFQKYLFAKSKGVSLHPEPVVPEAAKRFVELLKQSLVSEKIVEVWLFGSYARGDHDADSDVDLAVILYQKGLKESKAIVTLAEKAMDDTDFEDLLSIHEMDEGEWVSMKDNHYLMAQTIAEEGVLLWKPR